MNQHARQVGLENIRAIQEQLRRTVAGPRIYTEEEKIARAMAQELERLLASNESIFALLCSLMDKFDDPTSPEYERIEQSLDVLNAEISTIQSLLNGLPTKYRTKSLQEA